MTTSAIFKSVWLCPKCKHEQEENFEWCGKNLKCQGCGKYSYYSTWTTTCSLPIFK